jgi:methyl-accepting chemotaxis protein
MSLQEQIKAAVGAHGMWKARLRQAIDTGVSEFSPTVVRRDDQCEFGKWLHSASEPSVRTSPHYKKCVDTHRQFHEAAAKVMGLATSGQKANAEREIGLTSDFAKISATLTGAMNEWSRSAPK